MGHPNFYSPPDEPGWKTVNPLKMPRPKVESNKSKPKAKPLKLDEKKRRKSQEKFDSTKMKTD